MSERAFIRSRSPKTLDPDSIASPGPHQSSSGESSNFRRPSIDAVPDYETHYTDSHGRTWYRKDEEGIPPPSRQHKNPFQTKLPSGFKYLGKEKSMKQLREGADKFKRAEDQQQGHG